MKAEAAKKTAKNVAIGVGIGTAVGVTAGVLLAPKSGKETREEIAKGAKEVVEKVKADGKVVTLKTKHGARTQFKGVCPKCDTKVCKFMKSE